MQVQAINTSNYSLDYKHSMQTSKKLSIDYDQLKNAVKIERPLLSGCALMDSDAIMSQSHPVFHDNSGPGKPNHNRQKTNQISYSSVILDDYQQEECFASVCEYHFDLNQLLGESGLKRANSPMEIKMKQNVQSQANLRYMTHTQTSQKKLKANRRMLRNSTQECQRSHQKDRQAPRNHESRGPIINDINRKYHRSQQINMIHS